MQNNECIYCGEPVKDYEPEYCCNGDMCGCQGMPINPPAHRICCLVDALEKTEKFISKQKDRNETISFKTIIGAEQKRYVMVGNKEILIQNRKDFEIIRDTISELYRLYTWLGDFKKMLLDKQKIRKRMEQTRGSFVGEISQRFFFLDFEKTFKSESK